MISLLNYGESDEESDVKESITSDVLPERSNDAHSRLGILTPCPAPDVFAAGSTVIPKEQAHNENELDYNVKYEDLFTLPEGPRNQMDKGPSLTDNNTLTGSIEPAHVNNFQFENQRKTFHAYRYASDPSLNSESLLGKNYVGDLQSAYDTDGKTVFESTSITKKRKQERNDNPSDVKGFLGPWGKFADEQRTAKPTEAERAALEEILAKKHKRGKINEDLPLEEKSILHISNALDYQGRSFLHIPNDVGVNLRSDVPPSKCFLPKSHIHTWEGHSKGISTMRWFPRSAHLLLSASMDCRIKLWEVYQDKRCIRTYIGHRQAVKDVCWNNKGTQFLSAGYDRYIKLWDTETGDVISRFSSRKIPFCIKFHPDNNKQHLFVAGTSDKKIISWDIRCGEIVQEYDRHLGAVNTITFVDENRRFVTTSDDKSMRIWEWDIPVDMKYIADPTMHSMPAVTLAPNGKWLACQSLDNKIVVFSAMNRFKINRKKSFSGHMVSGYACTVDFSPDMSYLVSGDGDGKCYIWDWKTTKLYKKWQAHDGVCITTLWHPHEPSKLATAGWDGLIKFWD